MKKKKGHVISKIEEGSIAEEMELELGDTLISINGSPVEDVFDYRFLIQDEEIVLVVRKADGEEWELEIEKEYGEDLGIEFENGLMDDYRSCHNKCIFCFIDQMPPGMRETLYFKDDDSRLSFLQGNYVTLTNMSEDDINRIIRYRLEPINISVQSTIPELRCRLLHNRFAGKSLAHMDTLYEAGIKMNGQIVLCRGVNDGENLERCIRDLTKYIPYMESVSVVPAGLTRYRKGLYPLEPFTKEESGAVIDQIERWQETIYKEHGIHFIHASDEWYIQAERPFPEAERYDGYLQLENGVGMMRLLENEFTESLEKRRAVRCQKPDGQGTVSEGFKREISIATGKLAYPLISSMAERVCDLYSGLKVYVYCIRNDFFGETITVSGLITGQDLEKQLGSQPLGEELLLPHNILRMGEDVFLDDMTKSELEQALMVPIRITGTSGEDFIRAVLGEPDREEPKSSGEEDDFVEGEETMPEESGFVYTKQYKK